MTCPDCTGSGVTVAHFVRYADGFCGEQRKRKCFRCSGAGVIDDKAAEWMRAGQEMRTERLRRNMTLRAEAARRGMTPTRLSAMEQGNIEPVALPEA